MATKTKAKRAKKAAGPTDQERERLRRRAADMFASQIEKFGYEASKSSRLRRQFQIDQGSADWNIDPWDREALRSRSRFCYANCAPFRGFINRMVDLVVGRGLSPKCPNQAAQDYFMRWANDPFLCDVRATFTYSQRQRELVRSMFVDGDVFDILTRSGALQLIESDRVRTPSGSSESTTMADGVELDSFGRPVAYHIGDYQNTGGSVSRQTSRVRASFVTMLASRDRAGQTRGVPFMSPVLNRFDDLEDYMDFSIVAAKMAAMFGLIFETPYPQAMEAGFTTGTVDVGSSASGGTVTRDSQNLESGSILFAPSGTQVKQVQGQHPSTTADVFLDRAYRIIAAATGVPVEIGMLDNSKANFSVSRMAELQARHAADPFRSLFVSTHCDRVWRFVIARGILEGAVPDTPDVYKVTWVPPGRQMIDPKTEVEAYKMLIDNNLRTREDVVAELGDDYERVAEQRAYENELEDELGIRPSDPAAKAAVPTPEPPDAPQQ